MSKDQSQFIAVHQNPAWREKADYIFRCKIDSDSEVTEWEQMWGSRHDDGSITLCCIPFFAYGLALGDVVEIDRNGVFVGLKDQSDNWTVRVWTREVDSGAKRPFVDAMLKLVDNAEMHSDDLIAFSVPTNKSEQVLDFLAQSEHRIGVMYEIANR